MSKPAGLTGFGGNEHRIVGLKVGALGISMATLKYFTEFRADTSPRKDNGGVQSR